MAPVTPQTPKRPYPPRRKPAGRPAASVADKIVACLAAEPECVLPAGVIAHRIGIVLAYLDAPLTSLVLSGALIELKAGFAMATPAALAQLKAEEARPARQPRTEPLRDLARRIVARAHELRLRGRFGGAADLLQRAALRCRCSRVAMNFYVLAVLFGEAQGPYRDITRRQAREIALAAGCEAEA